MESASAFLSGALAAVRDETLAGGSGQGSPDAALGASLVFLSSVVTLCVDTWGECV